MNNTFSKAHLKKTNTTSYNVNILWNKCRKTASPIPPAINLKERWLEDLGFFSGKTITFTIEQGKPTI